MNNDNPAAISAELYQKLSMFAAEHGAQPVMHVAQQERVNMLCAYIKLCCDNYKQQLMTHNIGITYHIRVDTDANGPWIALDLRGIHPHSTEVLSIKHRWTVHELSLAYAANEVIRVAVTNSMKGLVEELEQRYEKTEQRLRSTSVR